MNDARRFAVAGVAMLVVLVNACGGRSADTTAAPTTPAPVATSTTDAPPTTAPPAPTTTTTEPPPTTVAPLSAQAAALAGTWQGSWTNTTFGSNGPAEAILDVLDDGSLVLTLDLGGSVFGRADPDAERWIIGLSDLGGPVTVPSATFGDVVLILSSEGARLTAGNVPADGIASFQLDATFDVGPRIVGTYLVGFEDGSAAEGTAELQRIDP